MTLHTVRARFTLGLLASAPLLSFAGGTPAPTRYTDETPDAMIGDSADRATSDHAAVAAIAEIVALADRANEGTADGALAKIAQSSSLAVDVRNEALLAARMIAS